MWTAHHTFLESRHPEVIKNLYYVLSTCRSQIPIFLGSSSWTITSFIFFIIYEKTLYMGSIQIYQLMWIIIFLFLIFRSAICWFPIIKKYDAKVFSYSKLILYISLTCAVVSLLSLLHNFIQLIWTQILIRGLW